MLIYYLIIFYFSILAVISDKFTLKAKEQIIAFSSILLIFIAGLRAPSVDKDYGTYIINYKNITSLQEIFLHLKTAIEPSFIIISVLLKKIFKNGFPILIFIYALFGVSLKVKGIFKVSSYPFLSLLIYVSTLFFLQEMTQIRIGLAVGIIFISFKYIQDRKILKFLSLILLATFFHYSSIVFIIAYFLNPKKINKLFYVTIIIVPLLMALYETSLANFITKIDLGIYSEKIQSYISFQHLEKSKINLLNLTIIFQIVLALFFIYFSEQIDNFYVIMFTKLLCIGISLFYIFSFIPVMSFRLFELLSSVQIFLIPLILKVIKPKFVGEVVIILISILLFFNQIVLQEMMNKYQIII